MATAPVPQHHTPTHSHSHSNSFSASNFTPGGHHRTPSYPSGPSTAPLSAPLNPLACNPNTTKILLLSGFPPSLKTRDIQLLFGEFEHIGGGLKIKWKDDEACFVVFADAPVAKRAYLALVANPPEALREASGHRPRLEPYTGADVAQIVASVAGRPRSRSVAGQGGVGHARRGSSQGGGGGGGGSVGVGAGAGGHQRQQSFGREGGVGVGVGGGLGHGRNRSSFGQQQLGQLVDGHPDELDESAIDDAGPTVPGVPKVPDEHARDKEQVEPKQVHNKG